MRWFIAFLIFVLSIGHVHANDANWRYWSVDEPQGTSCFAGVRSGPLLVGFYAMKGGPIYGFIEANLPGTSRTQWQVEGFQYRVFSGEKDAASGVFFASGIQQSFLTEIADGHRLAINTVDGRPDSAIVPLVGSADAISSFRACNGSRPLSAVTQTPPVVTPRPIVAPQPAVNSSPPPMSPDVAMDRLTTYTTVLGRGIGCNIDTQVPQQRVYAWLKQVFATDLETAQFVYLTGLSIATKQQMDGMSPDTCSSLVSTIATFPWP